MRIALEIEYEGTRYYGWQRQDDRPTVQEAVERAVSVVAAHPVVVCCAGRTDAGVHAEAQVVHFDTESQRHDKAWVMGVNRLLPPDIAVRCGKAVRGDFHARFSAMARAYRYRIYNAAFRSVQWRHYAMWYPRVLDECKMAAAAGCLTGEHDFSSFRGAECQARHPVRKILELGVTRAGPFVDMHVKANGFLQHMARNIVGVLLAVGVGKRDPAWVAEVLAARDRKAAGITAPARGLCLVHVEYPPEFVDVSRPFLVGQPEKAGQL